MTAGDARNQLDVAMDKLTLHMELTAVAYEALQRDGYLVSSPSLIEEQDWLPAYRWLTAKMIERLPASDWPQEPWPLWAWLQKDGKTKGFRISASGRWMVKFQKSADEVLLSDYVKWHAPLNRTLLHDFEEGEEADREYEEFQDLLVGEGLADLDALIERSVRDPEADYPQHVWEFVHRTWERVFDLKDAASIQATFWRLDLNEVIGARQRCQAANASCS